MDITELLKFQVQNKASDLHISSGEKPMVRIDGEVKQLDLPVLDQKMAHALIYDLMNDRQRKEFEEHLEVDFSFELPDRARFRVNAFRQERGSAAVMRHIPNEILSFDQIRAPKCFTDILNKPNGLILVTGPTGSGKTTTLASMVDYLNDNKHHHILTIEDPIEFVHTSKKSLVNQREVHRDTHSFSNALRSALREDPDIILVGELRDLETIRLALTAAETGHLVFGTLHTTSAPKTIDRVIDVFPGQEKAMVRSMLSESLQAVVAQTLLKRQGGGRCAAYEVMLGTSAVRNLIREDKTAQLYSTLQTGASVGMQTLDQDLKTLLMQGMITPEQAKARAHNPQQL